MRLPAITIILAAALGLMPTVSRGQSASAVLAGSVLSDSSERPIANAEIRIITLGLNARSDSAGSFTLARIPAGIYDVTVRAAGHQPLATRMQFANGQRVEADLLMRPVVQTLEKVAVTATKSSSGNNPRIAEFDARRKMGFGHFLTQDVIEKYQGRTLGELLIARIPGVGVSRKVLVARRGQTRGAPTCPVQIIVDDVPRYIGVGDALFNIEEIEPQNIAAIEFYTVAQRPLQFNRSGAGAPCGTLVIWTRY